MLSQYLRHPSGCDSAEQVKRMISLGARDYDTAINEALKSGEEEMTNWLRRSYR